MPNHPTSSPVVKQPLISFIVTYYNLPPRLLHECIESILALSLNNEEREIIVIDDGSHTSPVEELKDLAEHIIYIRQPNRGLSMSRNLGIEACSGEYIQFVDGDDRLNTIVYEHCLDLVRSNHPDIVTFLLSDKEEHEVPTEYEGHLPVAISSASRLSSTSVSKQAFCMKTRNSPPSFSFVPRMCMPPRPRPISTATERGQSPMRTTRNGSCNDSPTHVACSTA